MIADFGATKCKMMKTFPKQHECCGIGSTHDSETWAAGVDHCSETTEIHTTRARWCYACYLIIHALPRRSTMQYLLPY